MATSDLNFVRVIPKSLDINSSRNKMYGILAGSPGNTGRTVSANSLSSSQITWQVPPPNAGTYIGRRFLARIKFRIDFTGTSAGAGVTLLQAAGLRTAPGVNPGTQNYDAPRSNPIAEACNNVKVTLNGYGFTTNLQNYSRIYQRFHRNEFQEDGEFSYTPSMPDQSQTYAELNQFERNPLNGYGNNTAQCPRGGYSDCIITANTSTGTAADTASVELTVTEALIISPLSFDSTQEQLAFIGINAMDVNILLGGRGSGVLTGLAQALWSHSTLGSALTTATATVLQADLIVNFLTPSSLQTFPSIVSYNYNNITRYPTTASAPLAPGASAVIPMNSIVLSSVPNRLYVFVAPQDSQTNITDTDTFCNISNINITFGNQDGILSNYSPQQLYETSLKNGLNYSWTQWQTKIGSVLCIAFGEDIQLRENLAPGSRSTQSLSMLVTCTNIHPTRTFTPQLNVVSVEEGVMTVNGIGGLVAVNTGVLDEKDVINSWDTEAIPQKPATSIYGAALGGGFWDDVGSFFKKLVRPGINVAKSLAPPQFQPLVGAVSDVASSYGLGIRDVARRRGGALLM